MRTVLLAFALLFSSSILAQDCEGQHTFTVVIQPDAWPYEMSWELTNGDGDLLLEANVANADDTLFTFCVDSADWEPCMVFTMNDTYGDGLVGDAFYQVWLDGEQLVQGSGNYGYGQSHAIDCPPGWTCNEAIGLELGDDPLTVEASGNVEWWTFTPADNGMYALSSCGSGCDTRLWIYDYCNMNNFDDTNEGSIYYDDNQGSCEDNEESAQLYVLLEAGVTYWVRFANLAGDCGGFDWTLEYGGPAEGCTDETACNYNPAAEVDNGSCIYPGDHCAPGRT